MGCQTSTSVLDKKIQLNYSIIKEFFLPKQIKNLTLLYRASDHEYSAEKFHQVCDGIPNTLVVIKTEYDKTIGGFTPIPWNKSHQQGKFVLDISKQSFLFSVTQRCKIPLVIPKNAITGLQGFGPMFSSDLCIKDRSNLFPSQAKIGKSYANQIFNGSQQSYTRFTGSRFHSEFKTLDWEVYKVQFE